MSYLATLQDTDAYDEYDDECWYVEDTSAEKQFAADLRGLARQHVDGFFKNRPMHCGGRIPHSLLHNNRRLDLVLNTSIMDGVDIAYRSLSECEDITGNEDVKLVAGTLDTLAHSGVPQQFAGGLLLLYLEFCHGVRLI